MSGVFDDEVVDVGRWWDAKSVTEIDIVALAGRTRDPVMCGEVKWRSSINGQREHMKLFSKAAALTPEPEDLAYVLAARDEVVDATGVHTVTSADVFRA